MSFLAPLFLLGGAAIAAPIVFHLIRRATREQTPFSSLIFLRPSPPRLTRRSRLEHLWLLLLRCAALVLLAFAFARPFFRTDTPQDSSGALHGRVLLLVDASASMRREGLWAQAREAVASRLRNAAPGDEYAVYLFDRHAHALLSFEEWNRTAVSERVAVASARVSAAEPGWGGTHLGVALVASAEAILENEPKGPRGVRRIVLIGDVQEGSRLEGLQAYDWPKGVDLELVPLSAKLPTNAGVAFVAEGADGPASRVARVRVTNSSGASREQFELRWGRVGTQEPDAAQPAVTAYVPPGQSRVFSLPQPAQSGRLDRVILNGDDEPFDNVAFGLPPAQQSAAVLWLGVDAENDTRSPLFFLRRAYSDTPRVAVRFTSARPDAPLKPAELGQADLVFVADALPEAGARAVRDAILGGKTAVAVTRNSQMAGTLGALLGTSALPIKEAAPAKYAMFSEIDFQNPMFAPFADPRFSDFTKIHVWRHRTIRFDDVKDARVVARFDSGDPAVVEIPVGAGRLVVLATGWQPEDSQIAVSSKFVPLMWSLLGMSGAKISSPVQSYVGDPLELPAGTTAVRLPGGATRSLAANTTRFTETIVPGIYTLVAGDRQTPVAVNLDPHETRTEPLSADELDRLGLPVKSSEGAIASEATRTASMRALEQENRQKLWRWAIVATVVILLIETAAGGWLARRNGSETKEAAA